MIDGDWRLTTGMINSPVSSQSQALQSWVETEPFTHAFTLMPGPQSFQFDDVHAIALDAKHYLARALFGRKKPIGLWFVAVAECSSDQEIWHLHGCLNIKSKRLRDLLERRAEGLMEAACRRHHGLGGTRADFPDALLEPLGVSGNSATFLSYASKKGWTDPDGLRFIF